MSIVHIAGMGIRIGSKYRQRCAWCEAILIDGDLAEGMIPAGQEPSEPRMYEPNSLIDVAKDGPVTQFVVLPPADKLPPNACIGPPKLKVVGGTSLERAEPRR